MKRLFTGSILLVALLNGSGSPCFGQFGPANLSGGAGVPPQNLSPYLNQLRGRSAAVNYLFGVAPFTQQQRFDARSLYQDLNSIRRYNLEGPEEGLPTLPETGHPVRFLTYYPYYNLGVTANAQRSNLLYPFRPQPKYK